MTLQIDISEAQQRFLEIIQAAERGESIIITKDTHPIVQVKPAKEEVHRPTFGSARGLMTISDDFDEPLEEFREYMP